MCIEGYKDPDPVYDRVSNRPDAAILAYPVITAGKAAHPGSFVALFGENPDQKDLDYMSLEKHVTADTPPCFCGRQQQMSQFR